jgi:hypothetical protein
VSSEVSGGLRQLSKAFGSDVAAPAPSFNPAAEHDQQTRASPVSQSEPYLAVGGCPAFLCDLSLALRQRERDGLVVLAPAPGLRRGDPVRIARGIFTGELALYDGMRPHERVGVLLRVLGRVELPAGDVAPI